MNLKKGLIFYSVSIVLMALPLTFMFAGGPMMLARKYLGRLLYYSLVAGFVGSMVPVLGPQFWIGILAVALLAGFFVEALNFGANHTTAGLVSLLSACGIIGISTGIWIQTTKTDIVAEMSTYVDKYISSLSSAANVQMDAQALLAQIPSGIVSAMLICVWLGVLVERFIVRNGWADKSLAYPNGKVFNFRDFTLPEWMVWPTLATVLFTFVDLKIPGIKNYAANAFNFIVVLYFLQGVAIVSSFFVHHRVAVFWQVLWYFMLAQVYVVISVIGFADYWIDFRTKFLSTGQKENKKSEEEK